MASVLSLASDDTDDLNPAEMGVSTYNGFNSVSVKLTQL